MAIKNKNLNNVSNFHSKVKIKRKGVHAKSKTSQNKKSKNYRKSNRGQG